MSPVVTVVLKDGGRPYAFEAGDLELRVGDQVIVDTSRGPAVGRVVSTSDYHGEPKSELRRVVRIAGEEDLRRIEENREFEREARQIAADMVADAHLPMKVVAVESSFDQDKVLISFASEQRVDFRQIVSRLSERLGRRVELRQVSARDEARLIGGYGSCGRRLCCTLFAGDQDPVSIRMAKDQNLPLNPSKISGVCGRLMCCLKYERETYASFRERAPKKGAVVKTPGGEGRVMDLLPTRDSVVVDLGDGRHATYLLDELQPQRQEGPGQSASQEGSGQTRAADEHAVAEGDDLPRQTEQTDGPEAGT